MRALLIGRFQPFHKGHLKIITKILGEVDELIIAVGSSQHAHTGENPFSAGERMEMIKRNLFEKGINGAIVTSVPDINNDDLYPGHVMKLVPSFDVIYSGNSLVQRLFRNAGKEVREIRHIRRGSYSGSTIRQRILEGKKWKHLVPRATLEYLLEIDGVERIRDVAGRSSPKPDCMRGNSF